MHHVHNPVLLYSEYSSSSLQAGSDIERTIPQNRYEAQPCSSCYLENAMKKL